MRAAGDGRAALPVRATRDEFRALQQRWSWDQLKPTALSGIDVGAADIGYLKGFEAAETEQTPEGQVSYRWTDGHGYLRLTVPEGEGKLRIVVHWHSLAWPGKPDPDTPVRILLDGREAGICTAHPGWGEAAIDLPEPAGNGMAVIELLSRAAEPPGEDRRLLGVAVDTIRLEREQRGH